MDQSNPHFADCLNLPVYTTSGVYLGRVAAVETDSSGKVVERYEVLTPWSLTKLWRRRLLIAAEQVISLTPQAMIVQDLDVNSKSQSRQTIVKKQSDLAPEPTTFSYD